MIAEVLYVRLIHRPYNRRQLKLQHVSASKVNLAYAFLNYRISQDILNHLNQYLFTVLAHGYYGQLAAISPNVPTNSSE